MDLQISALNGVYPANLKDLGYTLLNPIFCDLNYKYAYAKNYEHDWCLNYYNSNN